MIKKFLFTLTAVGLLAAGCNNATTHVASPPRNTNPPPATTTPMNITSPAFGPNESIPSRYTCDGQGVNPPLEFSDAPTGAKSLVLLMDDPDVPKNLKPEGVFDHWVVYNMPPTTTSIAENSLTPGIQGKNGRGDTKYTAPCPPDREHRYFFKLYALDSELKLPAAPTKAEVETAMSGHILAQAELIGRYNKQK